MISIICVKCRCAPATFCVNLQNIDIACDSLRTPCTMAAVLLTCNAAGSSSCFSCPYILIRKHIQPSSSSQHIITVLPSAHYKTHPSLRMASNAGWHARPLNQQDRGPAESKICCKSVESQDILTISSIFLYSERKYLRELDHLFDSALDRPRICCEPVWVAACCEIQRDTARCSEML